MEREQWGSKIGVILAVAGSAIGLGNFLRFPVQMAGNGGGAFMIPYIIAFFLLGIPLIWLEFAMGRYGGIRGYGSTPGIFRLMWKNRSSKYFGVIGILVTFIIFIYYCYIESWTLGFSFFSISGILKDVPSEKIGSFLSAYQGIVKNEYFSNITVAYVFFLITLVVNIFVLYKGINKGIEKLVKIGMPLLFIMAIIIMIRVLTLGSPNPDNPDMSILNGLSFIWTPELSQLGSAKVWLAAAGQIFFTLSVGNGMIHVYASYINRDEDLALSALSSASTNEFAEVILGSTIAIPASVAFFGVEATREIAQSGAFNLGFQVLPSIFNMMPGGMFFGFLWFFLLFIAGITSSVSLAQPFIAFLKDELRLSHKKTITILTVSVVVLIQPVIFFLAKGFLDELDFWAGTLLFVVFAFIESVLACWIFGMDKIWEELLRGSKIKVPRIFYYIMKYITPLYLFVILAVWTYQKAIDVFLLKGVAKENIPYVLAARFLLLAVFMVLSVLVHKVWRRNREEELFEV